jgi:adenylate kinase
MKGRKRGKTMNLVFLGPPGAGKGTIAALAKERLGVPHISTGDLFRAAIKQETELGKQVKSILASGELVPDSVTVEMVRQRFENSDTDNGFILDGFPRTIAQADALAEMRKIEYVINFQIGRDEIVKRLSGRRMAKSSGKIYHIIYNPPKVEGIDDETGEPLIQREDDKEEAILNRLEVYERQTEPLISDYREKGLLIDLDAKGKPESIIEALLKVLGQ